MLAAAVVGRSLREAADILNDSSLKKPRPSAGVSGVELPSAVKGTAMPKAAAKVDEAISELVSRLLMSV